MKKTIIRLDDDLHKRLKVFCAENNVPMNEVVTILISDFLKLNNK